MFRWRVDGRLYKTEGGNVVDLDVIDRLRAPQNASEATPNQFLKWPKMTCNELNLELRLNAHYQIRFSSWQNIDLDNLVKRFPFQLLSSSTSTRLDRISTAILDTVSPSFTIHRGSNNSRNSINYSQVHYFKSGLNSFIPRSTSVMATFQSTLLFIWFFFFNHSEKFLRLCNITDRNRLLVSWGGKNHVAPKTRHEKNEPAFF